MFNIELIKMRSMNIFVVASDPGSANALMPVIVKCIECGHTINGMVSGSASNILGKHCPEIIQIDDSASIETVSNILKDKRSQIVLSGAGAFNLVEHTVRCAAIDIGIPCIAILDYWANYSQRFRRLQGKQWVYSLPNRICVLDEIVRDEMIAEGFASEHLVVTGQPYFEYILNWKNNLSMDDLARFRTRYMGDKESILIGFCSEPIVEDMDVTHNNDLGYSQYTTIEKVACILERFTWSKGRHIHLIIRPHPRENEEKLYDILRNMQTSPMFSYEISKIGTSLEFIVSCDLVIGMTSMALIEAYVMAHPVLSIQLNLKKRDTFYGTTRGHCPSVYTVQEIERRLEQWIQKPIQPSMNIPFTYGATNHIIKNMEELIEVQ